MASGAPGAFRLYLGGDLGTLSFPRAGTWKTYAVYAAGRNLEEVGVFSFDVEPVAE